MAALRGGDVQAAYTNMMVFIVGLNQQNLDGKSTTDSGSHYNWVIYSLREQNVLRGVVASC